jgi:HEAT repeat protein
MRSSRLVRLAFGAACLTPGVVTATPGATTQVTTAAEPGRWPTWPTEIDEIAAPLRDPTPKASQERDRENALRILEEFATAAIVADIVHALDDTSTHVRREALRICYERRITACTPGAVTIWTNNVDPQLRVAALKVLAVDPDPAHVAILLSALRESSDHIRADAARFLGWAALTPAGRKNARAALVAKLGDISALVRQRAVQSLGLLGSGPATLAVARLLDDPEPAVRIAAAEALGRSRDPSAAPALIRAIDGMNEPMVTKAMIEALAQLPGSKIAEELLARFDDPPSGLSSRQIGDAMGNRPSPEAILIEGLVSRLREQTLRPAAIVTLLVMGEAATDALRHAERRGLSPAVAIEVRRLLAATEIDTIDAKPLDTPWPDDDDHGGWLDALQQGSESARLEAAQRLATLAPPWLDGAITAKLQAPGPLAARRPWVVALTLASRPMQLRGTAAWTMLEGWALDPRSRDRDRCLAASALGAAIRRAERRRVRETLARLLHDPDPLLRACAALPLVRVEPGAASMLERLLLDPEPGVRVSAALALASTPLPKAIRTRLALLHAQDPRAEVRVAARLALRDRPLDSHPVRWEPSESGVHGPSRWLEVDLAGERVVAPALGASRAPWALVPGVSDAGVGAAP